MLIGLISDTHIPDRAKVLPEKVIETFRDVDMIFHAGDLTSHEILEKLNEIASLVAVQGNTDRIMGLELPKHEVVEVNGLKIGLVHGEVYPRGDTSQLAYIAKQMNVNILVSGHTHQPQIKQIDNILLLNPGSPTIPRLADRTVMKLEINNEKNVDIEVVKVGDPVCSALDFSKFK